MISYSSRPIAAISLNEFLGVIVSGIGAIFSYRMSLKLFSRNQH